jgi:hypothetical protein
VSKSDFALGHRLLALSHLAQALADRQPVSRRRRGHAAVESHPVDGAVGAFLVPVLGLVKGGGELRELQLQAVDLLSDVDQFQGKTSAFGCDIFGRVQHETSIRTNVWLGQSSLLRVFFRRKEKAARSNPAA